MIRSKIILTFLVILFFGSSGYCISLDEITEPLPPVNRLGIGNIPEKTYSVKNSKKVVETKESLLDENNEAIKNLTYADLSLKKISKEISYDLEIESENICLL